MIWYVNLSIKRYKEKTTNSSSLLVKMEIEIEESIVHLKVIWFSNAVKSYLVQI